MRPWCERRGTVAARWPVPTSPDHLGVGPIRKWGGRAVDRRVQPRSAGASSLTSSAALAAACGAIVERAPPPSLGVGRYGREEAGEDRRTAGWHHRRCRVWPHQRVLCVQTRTRWPRSSPPLSPSAHLPVGGVGDNSGEHPAPRPSASEPLLVPCGTVVLGGLA